MTKNECPLGDDCDLLIAYKHGLSSARDIILQNGKLEAERDEAKMQSLADLGQAQDALEAQKKAEAERDKLREALDQVDVLCNHYAMTRTYSEGILRTAHKDIRDKARKALGETEK